MKNYLYIQFEQGGYMYFQTPDAQSLVDAIQVFIEACNSISLDIANIEINRLELRDETEDVIEKALDKTLNVYEWLHELQLRTADSYVNHIKEMWSDIGGIKKMEELAKAEREKRILPLPVPLGTEVYRIVPSLCERRNKDRCDKYCDGWDTECEEYVGQPEVFKSTFRAEDITQFGKTVFLTEKEAKDAADSN